MKAVGKRSCGHSLTSPAHIFTDIKDGKGPKENLFINADTPKPEPGNGEALVKIKAFGINRMDQIQRMGNYPLPPQAPKTLGVEFSGTIESFGDGEHGSFKTGDEVFGLAYGGAYAEYIAVNSKMLLHKPDFLSWEQAAGIPEVSLKEHNCRRTPLLFHPFSTASQRRGFFPFTNTTVDLDDGDTSPHSRW